MKRTLFLSILIVFFTISFLSIVGCNPSKEDDQLQEQCGKLCEEYFKKEYGDGVFDDKEHSGSIFYKYHYNKKMKKCFILFNEHGYKRSDDKLYGRKSLLDINEMKQYGLFYNIGTSTVCDVLGKKCKSEGEWDALVKPFMTE